MDIFPLAVWQEGTPQNAIPANENTIHIQAAFGAALGFSGAAPGSPAAYDQYVIRTAWGGFGVDNVVIYVNGAWREFASFAGMAKLIGGVRYVKADTGWNRLLEWVDVPATSASPGVPGDVARDLDTLFFYVCTAPATWRRCALSSTITPPPPPPMYPVPALLLDYEDATVIDRSPNAITIGHVGAAVTADHKKFGAQGIAINGGYLTAEDDRLIAGTGDFTFDMWIYPTAIDSERFILDCRRTGGATGTAFSWLYEPGGFCGFFDGFTYIGSDSTGQSGIALVPNVWQHIEVGRHAGTIYLFLNGVLIAQSAPGAFPNNFTSPGYVIHAGQYFPIGVSPMPGYADEVRFVIGECVHTDNFLVPTAPYPTY